VREEFAGDDKLALILDGGASQVGIESTIVDLSRLATHGPVLLRPGHISADDIAAVIGQRPAAPDAAAPRASGTLESHYAPSTPVVLQAWPELADTIERLAAAGRKAAVIHFSELRATHGSVRMPSDPQGYAHDLYAALRSMDHVSADIILVETPPQDAAWLGVNDRLRRAAHGSAGALKALLA
jgi:L-threonylcarbamoyladenylate synthase